MKQGNQGKLIKLIVVEVVIFYSQQYAIKQAHKNDILHAQSSNCHR